MFRQISIGAAAVFTAGALAVGCSNGGGDTIITGSNGDINNVDNFGATTVGSNNLAPDGGGLSPDDCDVTGYRLIFNENKGSSDGPSTGDCSAVILFSTSDGRTFVTHYNASTITPPVELQATDHAAQPFGIQSAVVSFLNTSGYENSAATADVVNNVRANNGCILLLMAGETSFQDLTLNISRTGGANRGVHTGLWSWLFVPAFRGTEQLTASATSNPVGSITATTNRYYNAPTNQFRFGWQQNAGAEISLGVGSGLTPAVTGGIDLGTTGVNDPTDSPRSDVVGFGILCDGNQREQNYAGSFNVSTSLGVAPARSQTFATAGGPTAALRPSFSEISPGEAVNLLHLVYTQIVTSLDQGSGFVAGPTATGFFGGSTVAAYQSSFNLQSLSFETVGRITAPGSATSRNVAFGTSMLSYNNIGILSYREMVPAFNVTNFDPYQVVGDENILLKVAARQSATGGSTLGSIQDLSVRTASAGVHSTFNPAATVLQESEDERTLQNNVSLFGRDEGLAETVVFFTATDNTLTGGQEDTGTNVGNVDRAVYSALLSFNDPTTNGGTGVIDGDLVTGVTNPLLISRHDSDDAGPTGTQIAMLDPAEAVTTQMNRTGEYVLVGYVQDEGGTTATTIARRRTLKAVCYQTVRFGSATVAFPSRFSTPFEVSDPASLSGSSTTVTTGNTFNVENNLPVNGYQWEGAIDYRCGFQSNNNVIWALWEQSTGSEDRLFARAVVVLLPAAGTPSFVAATNNTVELDEQVSEQVQTLAFNSTATGSTFDRNQVNFLNNSIVNGTGGGTSFYGTAASNPVPFLQGVQSCDLGTAGAQSGAGTGGLFLCYRKTTDNTRPDLTGGTILAADGDGFDAGIIANSILLGATADQGRVAMDVFNEDDLNTGAGSLTTGQDVFTITPVGDVGQIPTANQPNGVYVFFTEPTQANAGAGDPAQDGLFARYFDMSGAFRANTSTGTAADFQASFFPSVATGTATAPARLDHTTGGDVENLLQGENPATAGNAVGILWHEDGHDWANGSADGRNFLTSGGAPAPVLVDQDRSSDTFAGPGSQFRGCENDSCVFSNGVYMASKKDVDLDIRMIVRGSKVSVP